MDKLNMQTTNIVDENIKRIGELFPNCLTERLNDEGKPEMAIDFDQLRQELSKDIVEGAEERYQFTWPDKRNAIRLANAPTTDTLRPCREESVEFDNTQNLYIEGDNLQVLKLLRENYLGKVKMIYIDPPYNTGNDFVYNDSFRIDSSEWSDSSGDYDEDGYQLVNSMVKNTEANGRFHTDWLNMIYPRLKVAKDLLSEDGVIFISIGQDEIENIIRICNEIFGKKNELGVISRQMKSGGGAQGKFFTHNIDYIVSFARRIEKARLFKEGLNQELIDKVYNKIEQSGNKKGKRYRLMGLYQASLGDYRPNQKFYITCPDGEIVLPPCSIQDEIMREGDGRWRWTKEKYDKELVSGNVEFIKTASSPLVTKEGKSAKWNIYSKIWLEDRQEEGATPSDLFLKFENRHSAKELNELNIPFDFAKPIGLIKHLISITQQDKDIIILDFFSGSATTAHAVMQLNSEDDGNRKFIMVQLPELTVDKGIAYQSGFKNICEIGKERIRRAGKKIVEELKAKQGDLFSDEPKKLDVGFRVLKLDSSNMQDVYYTPSEFNEQKLFDDNIKPDRTEEDLLFQTMIELGIELSAKIEKRSIAGKTVWSVSDGYLMACFDEEVNETAITEIARQHPYYFVMRDSSLANDQVADNFEQIWEEYSKDTVRRIL